MQTHPYVTLFKNGDGKNRHLLGGKGANLCEMTQIGLNVPPGFVITTEACRSFLQQGLLPSGLMEQVILGIRDLEVQTGKQFGGESNPLLVSVRSGSALSMPGMMDTILNLGLNTTTLQGLIRLTQNERFGYDAYRRFIQLFGKVALGVKEELFDQAFEAIKQSAGVKADVALEARHLKAAAEAFLAIVQEQTGKPFPENVFDQLELSIRAVFNSWNGKRAVDYRKQFNITPEMADGTAVNVVSMVFGNLGNDCATGVGFTRNPGTGENEMFGEYLVNAQGEDVVAGIRTPKPVNEMMREMPELYAQLVDLRNKLEAHYREVQDYEYTIERGVLYCLQTRNAKMNAEAMVRTSVELHGEGLITKEEAIQRVQPLLLEQLLHPRLDPTQAGTPIAQGLPASPGAASGRCVFDADQAEMLGRQGQAVILVREETKPEDIHGFFQAQGILTSRGGKTSHAAVVARGMGKACVAGAEGIEVDGRNRIAKLGEITLREGDLITIDGSSGYVYLGEIPKLPPEFSEALKTLLFWADETAHLKVMANGDTPDMVQVAMRYGAKGIGLCRTERMFNASDRLPVVVEMILAQTLTDRLQALDQLLPMQRQDFLEMLKLAAPNPVTIRLLDPPMHEFLPSEQQLLDEIEGLEEYRLAIRGRTAALSALKLPEQGLDGLLTEDQINSVISKKSLMLRKVRDLHEVNPMLGHRGVRLGTTYPEIYAMQIRAILEATAQCLGQGIAVQPEIMVPQVITVQELKYVREIVDRVREDVETRTGQRLTFKFGTMVETVRACMRASDLAGFAEFFSFGTNDLTQATFSFSREDAENKFLPLYTDKGILLDNPFEKLDTKGVGVLMQMSLDHGRARNPGLKVGICGEQAGDPDSIRFCDEIGINYVSCSPHRVPIARLAAAQAAIGQGGSRAQPQASTPEPTIQRPTISMDPAPAPVVRAPEPTPLPVPEVKPMVEPPIEWPEEEEEEFESSWAEPTPVPETANPLTPGLTLEPETPEPMNLESAPPLMPEPVIERAQPIAPPIREAAPTLEAPQQEQPPAPPLGSETRANESKEKPKAEGNAFMRSIRSVKRFIDYVDKPKADEDPTRDIRGGAPIRLVGGVPVEIPETPRIKTTPPVTPVAETPVNPRQEESVSLSPVSPAPVNTPEPAAPAPRATGVEAYLSEMASQTARPSEERRVTPPTPSSVTTPQAEAFQAQMERPEPPPVRQSTGVEAYLNSMGTPPVTSAIEEPVTPPPVITPSFEPPQPKVAQTDQKKAPEGGVRKALFNIKRFKDYIDKPPHE